MSDMQLLIHSAHDKIIDLVGPGHFGSIGAVVDIINKAMVTSYHHRPGPETKSAIKERFVVALEYIRKLRFDMGWSKQRINDELPKLLILYLDQIDKQYEPSNKSCWGS
jgi:hypothetical protein